MLVGSNLTIHNMGDWMVILTASFGPGSLAAQGFL